MGRPIHKSTVAYCGTRKPLRRRGDERHGARRFLAVCRDSGEDDVRPPTLIANLDTRLLLDSIVSSFSVDSTTNAIDVELADFKLADYRPRGGPLPRWEEPDVGDPPGEPEAFPFSLGKFLLWPSPEEGN